MALYKRLENQYEEIGMLIEMGNEENDPDSIPLVEDMLKEFTNELETLRIETLLSDEYDKENALDGLG